MAMNKLFILCMMGLLWGKIPEAQPHLLTIEGEPGKFYLEHTVDVKENWYSVGRLYNISPREIAPFNGSSLSKSLEIGEQLKIPLTAENFSQNGGKSSGETLVPVYHTIQPKEWMYHISSTYNKVPIENLEKWNHITRDQAKAGMQLIVGYLKVKTNQSALANPTSSAGLNSVVQAPGKKEEQKTQTAAAIPTPPAKDEKKTDAVTALKTPPLTTSDTKTVANTVSRNVPDNSMAINTSNTSSVASGFFANEYSSSNKTVSGQAGTFKSSSGWQDGKYYALMNNVPVGNIVKIINPVTNKSVYAKVLGQLPDMKESAGLTIRLSNAASSVIGAGEGKFNVEVRY
jgi:LysM domain